MKSHLAIGARQDSLTACAFFDADIEWISVDPINVGNMESFKPTELIEITISNDNGHIQYVPVDWNALPFWARVKWMLWGRL